MKIKIKVLWFVFLFFNFQLVQAQIQGKVSDEKGLPLEFVTVVIKKAIDSSFVAYTRTNDSGNYKFEKLTEGNYLISFSLLGYSKKEYIIKILKHDNYAFKTTRKYSLPSIAKNF